MSLVDGKVMATFVLNVRFRCCVPSMSRLTCIDGGSACTTH